MKLRTMLWLIVVVCCIALGLWQRQNLSTFWREYQSARCDYEYTEGYPKLRRPIIQGSLAKSDPEASAIVNLALDDYSDEKLLDSLAENALKFPDNAFFLDVMAGVTMYSPCLDHNISLILSQRLAQFEPNDAVLHFLAAEAKMTDRKDNNLDDVLAEIEQAGKFSNQYYPYDKYQQRVIKLVEKANLTKTTELPLARFGHWRFKNRWLKRDLLGYANAAFTVGDYPTAIKIDDVIKDVTKTPTYMFAISFGSQAITFNKWTSPEAIELQRASIPRDRARENRFRLCEQLAAGQNTAQQKQRYERSENTDVLGLAVLPAIYSINMLMSLTMVFLIILAVCLIRGFGPIGTVTAGSMILFLTGYVFFFLAGKVTLFLFMILDPFVCHYADMELFKPIRFGLEDIPDPTVIVSLIIAGPPAALFILWLTTFLKPARGHFWERWYLKIPAVIIIASILLALFLMLRPSKENITMQDFVPLGILFAVTAVVLFILIMFGWWLFVCRLVRIALAAIFFGALAFLTESYQYIAFIPIILFALILALITAPAVSKRRSALWLLSAFIVVSWVTLVILSPLCSRFIKTCIEPQSYHNYEPAVFEPDKTAYDRVLTLLDANDLTKEDFYKLIGLVMPEDLSAVLNKIKKRGFQRNRRYEFVPIHRFSPEQNEVWMEEKQRQKKLIDWDLAFAMQNCGRDVAGIITEFFDDPNYQRALVIRGKLGDVTAKGPLEKILNNRLQSDPNLKEYDGQENIRGYMAYWQLPPRTFEIIAALAPISEPNEATERFIDYIHRRDTSKLRNDYEFFENINLLPSIQARIVIKDYLAVTKQWNQNFQQSADSSLQHDPENVLYPLRWLVRTYGDREISETVFGILLGSFDEHNHFYDDWGISPYFTIDSSELLKKGLVCSDDSLRAWCVWQLRKVGYNFNQEEIDNLMRDKSWMVRSNAVASEPQKAKNLASRDKNSFVRFVVTLYADSL
jgi:hypothetical protein